MDDKTKETIIGNLAKDYEKIYAHLTFISDETARARAANGLMVYLSQVCDYGKSILSETAPDEKKPEEKKEEKPQPNRIDTPPYDELKKRWNYCEAHPDEEIKFYSDKTNRYYYACHKCGEFLNKDGTRTPMNRREQSDGR